jgi:transcriptional regulator with XRE-family HTH domain
MSAITHIREKLFKMKQAPFALAVGVSQATVSRWENGAQPGLDHLQQIRDAALERGFDWDDKLFFEAPPQEAEHATP